MDEKLLNEGESGRLKNVGGTKGGLGEFLIGLALLIAGTYLLLDNVIVSGNFWSFFGFSSFGLSLIPLFIGIIFLFFNGKSKAGWILTGMGAIIIFVGILAQMHIFFKPTSLFNTLLMLVMMAAGIGLILRSLRTH
jgi:hypothetical protein